MKLYTPKQDFPYEDMGHNLTFPYSVFIGGTIDSGEAEDWQKKVIENLNIPQLEHIIVFNPRINDWDYNIKETVNDDKFKKQVTWEQDGLEYSKYIFMNILDDSRSIISLSELGQYANSGKLMVVAGKNYFKRGNIEVLSKRFNFPLFDKLESGLNHLINTLLSDYLDDVYLIRKNLFFDDKKIKETSLRHIELFAEWIRKKQLK